ncbi:MAG TPA: hypothetical protein DEA44_05980 [Firmicutes bacterium]|nr:hypothetical protein [Bacillota bacterium]
MSFNRVTNDTTIVGEVLKQITGAISQGAIRPGEKIPTELELMAQFGVGRNSVREAVKMLSALGVLEVKRGSGTFVTREVTSAVFNPLIFSLSMDRKTANDLSELRIMFEMMVTLLVIDKITEKDIPSLEQLLAQEQELYAQGKTICDDFVEFDLAFYSMMLQFTYNPLIQRIGRAIMELFPPDIRKSRLQENGLECFLNNHRSVVEAIKGKDKLKVLSGLPGMASLWKNYRPKETMPVV